MKLILRHMTFAIGVVLLFATYACTDRPQAPLLVEAENLMKERPDSAYSILSKIENVNQLSEKDYATYCLLLTQAQDLNYITHTSDSLIKIAATYFEKQQDLHKASLSFYYMGRVNADLYDALKAQEYYLKALEVGEHTKDYYLLARICNNLGTLYNYQDIYDMALPIQKRALYYLEQETKLDSANVSFVLRNIARTFMQTQERDSAILYFKRAINYSTPNNISSISLSLGNLHFDKGEYKEAKEYIDKALSLATNKSVIAPILLSKSKLYIITEQLDSAKYLLNLCSQIPYIYTKAGCFQRLAQIALIEQNLSGYVKYTQEYEQLRDSITNSSHIESIRIAQSMFKYQRITKEKNLFEQKATQRMIYIYQISILLIIVSIISIVFIKREQRKKKRLAVLKEEQYKRSQQYIEDNEKQIQQLTETLHSKQVEISEAERKLYEARKLVLEMENRQIFEKQGTLRLLEQDFYSSSIYLKIHREENIQLSPSEWEELHQLLDATYPNFTNRLIRLYPQISIEEIHICYLVKMQLPIKKIAFIMNITSSGVSQCRKRLYQKFTGEPQNAEKLDSFIADF